MKSSFGIAVVTMSLLFVAPTAEATDPCPGTPGFELVAPTTIANGDIATFNLIAPPGLFAVIFVSFGEGPNQTPWGTLCLDFPAIGYPLINIPANGSLSLTRDFCKTPIVGQTAFIQFVAVNPNDVTQGGVSNQLAVEFVAGECQGASFPAPTCLVIIDEDTIDNDIKTIEAAAANHNVEADYLVNDDIPTEGLNPPLRWNTLFPGDIVLIPGGQVDDEGLFALPETTPWNALDYGKGLVPQEKLDKIKNVMPLRNHELHQLVGRTCTAVVYDSDISMNFAPINANLQGARYGLFSFTVLNVVVAGSLDESKSDTSLYDLLVRVEPPLDPNFALHVPIHDHEPDAVEIPFADYNSAAGTVVVHGESDFGASAKVTCSIDGFVIEAPMTYNDAKNRWEFTATTQVDLTGRRVTVSTDHGGAYNSFID